jgi:hypothetical protein
MKVTNVVLVATNSWAQELLKSELWLKSYKLLKFQELDQKMAVDSVWGVSWTRAFELESTVDHVHTKGFVTI